MNGTESRLWDKMKEHDAVLKSLRRIESPITPGASDVEYVGARQHGWIELKTAAQPRKGRPYSLHCDFTVAQSEWLLAHDHPPTNLRSFLLIGILGPRTWREFVLIDARNSIALIKGRDGVPHEELLKRKGVDVFVVMRQLIDRLDKGEMRDVG